MHLLDIRQATWFLQSLIQNEFWLKNRLLISSRAKEKLQLLFQYFSNFWLARAAAESPTPRACFTCLPCFCLRLRLEEFVFLCLNGWFLTLTAKRRNCIEYTFTRNVSTELFCMNIVGKMEKHSLSEHSIFSLGIQHGASFFWSTVKNVILTVKLHTLLSRRFYCFHFLCFFFHLTHLSAF